MAAYRPAPWCIYVLSDPRDGAVRYLGLTSTVLRVRLSGHMGEMRMTRGCEAHFITPKNAWLEELDRAGLRPEICSVASFAPMSRTRQIKIEREWIRACLKSGIPLLNVYSHPTEHGRAISEGHARTSRLLEARRREAGAS